MEDILKALVDSRQQGGTSQPQQGADPMASLIGGLLGGVQQQTGNSQQGADMANLIGGLLGGNQSQSQSGGHAPTPPSGYAPQQFSSQPQGGAQSGAGLGDLMGLLEGFMGGQGQGSTSQNDPIMALLQPFIAPLAKKANISPAIAAVVVSFLVHKLLAHHPTSGRDSNSFNLDEMLGQMSAGKVDTSLLHNSGMVRELSQKTGMNEQATEAALQAAIPLIGNTVSKFVKPSGTAAHAPVKPSSAGMQAKAVKKPAAKK
jgi:hypothetical protein